MLKYIHSQMTLLGMKYLGDGDNNIHEGRQVLSVKWA